MLDRIIVIAAAFLLDMICGDPHWLWHPVQRIGLIIKYVEAFLRRVFRINAEREADKIRKRVAGVIMVILVIAISLVPVCLILYLAGRINRYVRLGVEIIICYQMLAARSLCVESMKVYYALRDGTIEDARTAVSMIVGRDTASLNEEGVTKAAVETVAENTSDGEIAPLLYLAIGGPVLGFTYKAINTMDSMIGYKNERYLDFGRCAAKLDDIVNYIPARISAYCLFIAAAFMGKNYNARKAWHIYKRDRYQHASPNAAQTEAMCAGALGIRLAGDASYFGKVVKKPYLGDDTRPIVYEDILHMNHLAYGAAVFCLLVCAVIMAVVMI